MSPDDLIIEHIERARAVAGWCARRAPAGVDRDDLIGEAEIALVECAQRWEPGRGLKFWTFARHRVLGACRDLCRRRALRDATMPGITGDYAAPDDVERALISASQLEALLSVVQPRAREVLRLRYVDGLAWHRIGAAMSPPCHWRLAFDLHASAIRALRVHLREVS